MEERKSYPDWRCAHTDPVMGRCRGAGAASRGTRGDGPWFCTHHLFGQEGDPPTLEERIERSRHRSPMGWTPNPAAYPKPSLDDEEPGANG